MGFVPSDAQVESVVRPEMGKEMERKVQEEVKGG